MAGKAHPEDTPAKELIRQVMQFCRRDEVRKRFVFIEDYDMNVARWMVEGVDVWLNTPVRPLEASGTSGMKAAFNGGLNCSILDGWWDEAYKPGLGWAIGRGEMYADTDYQDEVESNSLYDLLEKEVVPAFYNREIDGRPKAWIRRMKESMHELCPVFSINRMVREYSTNMYWPAANRFQEFLSDDAAKAKNLAKWKKSLKDRWGKVKIGSVLAQPGETMKVGDDMKVSAWVDLGDFSPGELAVQIYHGPIDQTGNIVDGEVIPMAVGTEKKGSQTLFSSAIRYYQSGRHGFTVRVLPHHDDLASSFDTPHIMWASLPLEVQV
jgi:starch phosphorylase